jgi:hypothetical protein
MVGNNKNFEFEVFGVNVRFKPEEGENESSIKAVISYLTKEADKVKNEFPKSLDNNQISVLLALRLARENLNLRTEYRENIQKLQLNAIDALEFVEELSPKNS